MTRIAWLLVVAALLGGLGACAINPATGQGNVVLMSENRELELGKEEHDKVMQNMRVYDDEKINAYVNDVGERLVAVSHRPDLDFTFTVIDSPEINAFALPGGYVYVNRGLLAYLNSEAELAAVLAHEIGHITARHAIQQHARRSLSSTVANVGGLVAAVATGSGFIGSQIAEVSSLWAVAGLSGFGREHELESDRLSAEYLAKAGYDPNAVIDALTVLKNQEDFNTKVANEQPRYHGLFSTHPRNDTRLQQAVSSVGRLPESERRDPDPAAFRTAMTGLILGDRSTTPDRNRYYQSMLGYTIVFPDEWTISETPTTVTATAPDEKASLYIEVQRLQDNKEPRLFIREDLGVTALERSEELAQYRLRGYTGTVRGNSTTIPERLAVLYLGPRAYILRGAIRDAEAADQLDQLLLASIRTFRAIQSNERPGGNELKLRFVQANENFTFPALATMSPLARYPEETLRLLNGYYPAGNPEAGEWIKIVE